MSETEKLFRGAHRRLLFENENMVTKRWMIFNIIHTHAYTGAHALE